MNFKNLKAGLITIVIVLPILEQQLPYKSEKSPCEIT